MQQLDPRMRPHDRYIGVFDDTDTPSFVSDTPDPSRSPSVAESLRARSRAHLARAIARLELAEAAANNPNAANMNHAENEDEDEVPTPSNMSQSSTVVCRESNSGSRPVSPSDVGGGSDLERGSASESERLDGQQERSRRRTTHRG
ncbi:hypothetical protein NEMBOFW57_008609 [Staphylotrichum longicolle]|uniref:Uncharacterized protein n=1 Tax=Staphylotrichum longicolle TaxID=669026 RepID=A0AAD4ERH8_9PEZI|nr:hypothetical protein NEMBOFW57_008609 [Staphylotrichum longicolle]